MTVKRIVAVAFSSLFLAAAVGAHARPVETLLHIFDGLDGVQPVADLAMDAAGNLYGTANFGGAKHLNTCPGAVSQTGSTPAGCGVVFELSPPAKGQTGWTETVLHDFAGADGANPSGGLVIGKDGSLYGITFFGGAKAGCPGKLSAGVPAGCGLVFKLSPPKAGTKWTETILHRFGGTDGANPKGKLTVDPAGNFYGVTLRGGSTDCPSNAGLGVAGGCGTVFKLAPPTAGKSALTVLHEFSTDNDGIAPTYPPTLDSAGNLYGATAAGGTATVACPANLANWTAAGCGIVYKLTAPKTGKNGWTETVLANLPGAPGAAVPIAGLIFGKDGALYGTSSVGGKTAATVTSGFGTVFKVMPPAQGKAAWALKTLHSFDSTVDGANPLGTLLFDPDGNLYGTAANGGGSSGPFPNVGTVFELVAPKPGKPAWTEKIIHKFGLESLPAAALPESGVIRDKQGNFYGAAAATYNAGFQLGAGAIYKITP